MGGRAGQSKVLRQQVRKLAVVPEFGGSAPGGSVVFACLKTIGQGIQRVLYLFLIGNNDG